MSLELANILLDEIYLAIESSEQIRSELSEITFTPKQDLRLPALYISCSEINRLSSGRCQIFEITLQLDLFSRFGDQHQNISISDRLAEFISQIDLNLLNFILLGKRLIQAGGDTANDVSTNKFTTKYQFLFKERQPL